MFTSDVIWGLDIGDSCIKAVKMALAGDDFSVLDYAYLELDAEMKEKDGYLAVVQSALEDLAESKEFKRTEVCVSVSAKNVNSRFLSVENGLSPKAFKTAVDAEAERQIPFPLDEVEWGCIPMPGEEEELQVAIFAVRSEHINEILTIADDVGINVRGMQVPGVALYNFISTVVGLDEHVVFLDFGERTTSLIVAYDGAFWLRSLPLSGRHITDLLEKKFRITTKEASTLKHEMEKSPQRDKLFRVMEPKLKELVAEIKRSINFRKTQVKGLAPKKFLACGGSSQLAGVSDYFHDALKLKPFELKLQSLDFSACSDSDKLKSNIVSYGVAMGLAIQGLGQTESDLNLVPKTYVVKKILKSKRLSAIVINVALLILVVMAYLAGSGVTEKLEKAKKAASRQRSTLQSQIGAYKKLEQKLSPEEKKAEYLLRVLQKDQLVPRLYGEVASIIREIESVYLVGMSFSIVTPEDYMGKESDGAPSRASEERRGPQLTLAYVGENAKDNLRFYRSLLEHPLFKVAKGDRQPSPTGGPKDYEWSFSPKVVIEGQDYFVGDEVVAQLRKKRDWEFLSEGKPVKKEYLMNYQDLTLKVNLDALWPVTASQEGKDS